MSNTINKEISVLCGKCNEYEDYGFEAEVLMIDGEPKLTWHQITGKHVCVEPPLEVVS